MILKALLTVTLLVFLNACNKKVENGSVLHSLHNIYKDGSISECHLHGQLVYSAGLNAYDAGSTIYDTLGTPIGTCNYAWGPVDPMCKQLESCEVIYRGYNDISGQPFTDKYGLSKGR